MFPVRVSSLQRLPHRSPSARFVVLMLTAVLASCGTDTADGGATMQPEPTTIPTSTTTAPTLGSATLPAPSSTTTTRAPVAPDLPPLLFTGNGEVRLVADGKATLVVSHFGATMAVPDLRGGIVYATEQQGWAWWTWDAAAGRARLQGDAGWVPSAIYDVDATGDSELLVDGVVGSVQLVQVVELEGQPTLIYRAWRGGSDDCVLTTEECLWMSATEHLLRRDLTSGVTTDLGIVGSFESHITDVQFSEGGVLVRTSEYGADDGCAALFPITVLDDPEPEAWLGEGGALWRRCDFGVEVACEPNAEYGDSWCWGSFATTFDDAGTSIAYAMARRAWSGDDAEAPVLLLLDVPDLTERARIVIGEPETVTTWIDHDGSWKCPQDGQT